MFTSGTEDFTYMDCIWGLSKYFIFSLHCEVLDALIYEVMGDALGAII